MQDACQRHLMCLAQCVVHCKCDAIGQQNGGIAMQRDSLEVACMPSGRAVMPVGISTA